jgi:hypothetical protein
LIACIKSGDLAGFDHALVAAEDEFVKRRIYLTLERGRDIAMRNLLRKVFLAAGFEEPKEGQALGDRIRKSRIPLSHFAAALRMRTSGEGNGQVLDDEEVECMLANMIYKVRSRLQHRTPPFYPDHVLVRILTIIGFDERLYLTGARNGGTQQKGCFSWHGGVTSSLPTISGLSACPHLRKAANALYS